jgi:hypothetical protein
MSVARGRRASRTIAVASFGVGALIRIATGWGSPELRFGVYFPAILVAGLLAGVPAASGVAIAFVLFLTWAFVPIAMRVSVALRAPDRALWKFLVVILKRRQNAASPRSALASGAL